jgi:hypothetical protein
MRVRGRSRCSFDAGGDAGDEAGAAARVGCGAFDAAAVAAGGASSAR